MDTYAVVNITVEAFMAVISVIILWSLLTEKHDEGDIDGFLIVAFETNFSLLICDIVHQITKGIVVAEVITSIGSEILFDVTFVLYAAFCVTYLGGMNLIRRARKIIVPSISVILFSGVALWCVVSLIFTSMPFAGSLKNFHWITFVFLLVAATYLMIYFLTKFKYLGAKNIIILSLASYIPLTLISTEVLFGQGLVYAAVTPTLILIYTEIHIEKALLNVAQKNKISEQETELISQKNRIMVSQMQPHFMYNVLNSIYYLCEKNTDDAQEAISTFSDYLRINMDAMGKNDLVPFAEELRHVKTYLSLEKMRFEERLNVKYDIVVTNFKLPCLTLQPMVENAVKHGICKRPSGGTVTVSTHEIDRYYVIEIIDDGVGYDVNNAVKDDGRSHVGRASVKNRIEAMCGGKVAFESEIGRGSITAIYIPKELKIEEKA